MHNLTSNTCDEEPSSGDDDYIPNCEKYYQDGEDVHCYKCTAGKAYQDGECATFDENCLAVVKSGPTYRCNACKEGFVDTFSGPCAEITSPVAHCKEYTYNSRIECYACIPGKKPNSDGT